MNKSHIILACSILAITAGCSENAGNEKGITIISNLLDDLDKTEGVKTETEIENEAQGD